MFCILKVIHYYWLIFANLREKCFKIYYLESAKFLSAPGFVWQASLRKAEVKLELLTDTDMLLMVEKDIRGENVMQFIDMKKLITNIGKILIKIKNCHVLNIGV